MYLIPVHIVTEFDCRTIWVRHDYVHDFHWPVLLLYERITVFRWLNTHHQYLARSGKFLRQLNFYVLLVIITRRFRNGQALDVLD